MCMMRVYGLLVEGSPNLEVLQNLWASVQNSCRAKNNGLSKSAMIDRYLFAQTYCPVEVCAEGNEDDRTITVSEQVCVKLPVGKMK